MTRGNNILNGFQAGYYMPTESYFAEESSQTGDEFDDSQDDQESTEYEGEEAEVGGMEQTQQLPCFRQLVKAKKAELKAQYGKGHISIGECGIMPVRLDPTGKYNPIVRIGEQKICIGWGSPSCEKKCLGVCCGPRPCVNWKTIVQGNTAAYDAATAKYEADKAAWDKCRAENKGIWVPGWRREWRKFKKAGGLNQLKQESTRCILGMPTGGSPILPGGGAPSGLTPAPSPTPTGPPVDAKSMSCKDMAMRFGIVPGKTFGTAPDNVRSEWVGRKCTSANVASGKDGDVMARPGEEGGTAPSETGKRNKRMMIIGAIAVVVIIGIALLVRAMRSKK